MFTIVQRRKTYFLISGIIIGAGILAMIVSTITTGSPFHVGIDFRSGTRFEIVFEEPTTENAIRQVFSEFDINNPSVVSYEGTGEQNAWQIRTEFVNPEQAQAIENALVNEIGPLDTQKTLVQSVSPAVGGEVRQAAVVAIGVAAVIILVYIMAAFRQVPNPFRYGACAVAAMLHDILVIFGFIAIAGMFFGWEVDALFLTAVLTVAGFSLQDTIVVFDRIRENVSRRPLEDYEMLVNRSILETIHRSLATQLSAMFVLVAILLFGGESIRSFIGVLFVGIFSGTYSSIFTAIPLLVSWEKGEIPFLKTAAAR
ncbi:MAG: protein translocase subunit SecF [Anaerolineales bacterium]|nr:protein translocase subunit SecF [Anaerolineales bacterium]MCB8951979.1 protein translocase subunit SecF [Ardenticatenales bacterium]